MNNRQIWYIFGALLVGFIILVIASQIVLRPASMGASVKPVGLPEATGPATEEPAPAIHDINAMKQPIAQESADLKGVYANFPKSDVGGNMVEGWAKVKPEDKAKFVEELDKRISESNERLATNPDDKNAQHSLFISETLKNLAKNDFNYKLEKPAPPSSAPSSDSTSTK